MFSSTFGHLSCSALNNHVPNRQFTTSEPIGRRKNNGQYLFRKGPGNDLLLNHGGLPKEICNECPVVRMRGEITEMIKTENNATMA
jgi:hypothetical protein